MGSALLSGVLALARIKIVNHLFGAGVDQDAYQAAFTLPDLINYFLIGGAASISVITILNRYRVAGDDEGGDRALSVILTTMLVVLCAGVLLGEISEQFAGGFNAGQRRALGIRCGRNGKFPAPSQSTFCRFFAGINPAKLQENLLAIQARLRGPVPKDEMVVLDGKEPKHGSGASVLSAVTVPSLHYLGSAMVDVKTNEIPVAQKEVLPALDLQGRFVSLDALHTQDQTARTVVLEGGGDYLLTVKNNQPTLLANVVKKVAAPDAVFPPRAS